MARRKTRTTEATPTAPASVPATGAAPRARSRKVPTEPHALRVLVVGADLALQNHVASALAAREPGPSCDVVPDVASARQAVGASAHDVALIDLDALGSDGFELVRELHASATGLRSVLCTARPTVESGLSAVRCGAADVIAPHCSPGELAQRLAAAAALTENDRRQHRRLQRLKRICRRLNTARQDVNRQLDVLCNDLVHAYQELADQMSHVSLASEFSSLIRQELDVESLLRTTLEYLLTKTGPTNAAVFLPTGQNDYSLGAYVNYDLPKGAADVLLDHMADVVAPRFEDEPELIRIESPNELDAWFGDQALWLRDSTVLVFACRHDEETLAIAMLFRDRKSPFPADMLPKLGLMRDLFAEQLARVIQVHNRHRPRDQWPGFEVDPGEEDEGEGFGRGMAA